MRRSLQELISVDDPVWPEIQGWIGHAGPAAEALPADAGLAGIELYSLQVTVRSVLGALAYYTGGLLIDHGWLKVLGSGSPRCPWSITRLTQSLGWAADEGAPGAVAVGLDVLGGIFVINGGAIECGARGHLCYFDPSLLKWIDLECQHSQWVAAMLTPGRTGQFYEDLRWPGWESEVKSLAPAQGLSVTPPLFTSESRPIVRASRKAISLEELIGFHLDIARQLGAQ